MKPRPAGILVAVEGAADEPVARKLLQEAGLETSVVFTTRGKDSLDRSLKKYNEAAATSPWLVLRDLDQDAPCAGDFVRKILPRPSRGMRFRLAVRAIEAWLIADRAQMSKYLAVPLAKLPEQPEQLFDPKLELVNLARKSRRREIIQDMVPEQGLSSKVGPAYVSRLIEFAQDYWRPTEAAGRSRSLEKCRKAVSTLAERPAGS